MQGEEKKSFLKNIITLMSGSALAQVLTILSMPILMKYFYDPEDYTNFTWFFNFVMLFVGIGGLRLETGIVLEKENRSARILTSMSLRFMLISGLLGMLVAIGMSFFSDNFKDFFGNPTLYILVPTSIIILGFIQILTSWFTREGSFSFLAGNKIYQSTAAVSGQLSFGAAKLTSIGLIIGRLIGSAVTAGLLVRRFFQSKEKPNNASRSEKVGLLKKHKKFIIFTTPATFIGIFINFLYIDLFRSYYGETLTGDISASYTLIGAGFALVSQSFAQVFYNKLAEMEDRDQIRNFYTYWLIRLTGVAAIIITAVYLVPNSLVTFILGSKWAALLPTMKVMSLWMGVMFISSSLSYIYIKMNRQDTTIYFDLVHTVVVYLSIHISYTWYHDFTISLWWYTITQIAYYIVAVLASYYFINKYQPLE
jgi:lipopolysaccharide exporter